MDPNTMILITMISSLVGMVAALILAIAAVISSVVLLEPQRQRRRARIAMGWLNEITILADTHPRWTTGRRHDVQDDVDLISFTLLRRLPDGGDLLDPTYPDYEFNRNRPNYSMAKLAYKKFRTEVLGNRLVRILRGLRLLNTWQSPFTPYTQLELMRMVRKKTELGYDWIQMKQSKDV